MHASTDGSTNPLETIGTPIQPNIRRSGDDFASINVDVGVIIGSTAVNNEPTVNDMATRTITTVNSGEHLSPTYDVQSPPKQDTMEDYRPKP